MLEGTDLSSAYQTMYNQPQQAFQEEEPEQSPVQFIQQPSKPVQQTPQQDLQGMNNMNILNKQFETDQKLAALVTELKKKKAATQSQQESDSYFDRLFGKTKELYKILQISLMITLGLSVHFLVDHYLTKYLSEHEMSFERQLIIRTLYPAAVLFLLWNLRVFVK